MLDPRRRSLQFGVGLALGVSGLWLGLHWWLVTPTGATRAIYREPGFQGGVTQLDVVPNIDLDFIASAHAPRRFFSARWATIWYVEQAGTYDLSLGADDRGVLRVDGSVVVERNARLGYYPESVPRALSVGPHTVEVEYDQLGGLAVLTAGWAPAGGRERPFAEALLFPQAPTPDQIRINAWVAWLRNSAFASWLFVLGLIGQRGVVRVRAAGVTAIVRALSPWLAPILATIVVILAAAIRFEVIYVMYGPFERPSWLFELAEHAHEPISHLRPASLAIGRVAEPYVGGDPFTYLRLARSMTSFYAANVREPIHPYVTKLWLSLLADQDVAVSFSSASFSVLAVLATYLLGSYAFSRRVGLIAAVALAFERDVIALSAEGWRDDAMMAMFVLACWAFLRCLDRPTIVHAMMAGVIGGIAALTRITTLSFLLPAIAVLAWRGLRPRADGPSRGAYWRTAAISFAIMCAMVAPFLINCAIVFGDPFYSINAHTAFYRARAGLLFNQPMSVGSYLAMRVHHHPWEMLSTAGQGLTTYPFEIKWVGFNHWLRGLGRPLMWLSLAGTAAALWTRNGRFLAILLIASLLPYAFTWRIPGGGEWRFTMHAYPIYLIAMAYAITQIVSVALARLEASADVR
jgi:Dolichyl-phosphate-mannose-protein mannosyltransferase